MDEKIVPHLEESNRKFGDLEKTDIHAEFNKRLSFRMQQDVAMQLWEFLKSRIWDFLRS